jgi:hypothetical protein
MRNIIQSILKLFSLNRKKHLRKTPIKPLLYVNRFGTLMYVDRELEGKVVCLCEDIVAIRTEINYGVQPLQLNEHD